MRISLLVLLVSIVVTANVFAAVDLPPENEKWSVLRVDDFEIVSSASDYETREIAADLLRMRAALARLTHLKVRGTVPTKVFVFRSSARFAAVRDAILQRRIDYAGMFIPAEDLNLILLRADARTEVGRLVFHELTHSLLANTVRVLPPWVNEGVAEYYSTFESNGKHVTIGRPIHEHVQVLREGAFLPLAQLFALEQGSKAFDESARHGVLYAQSWALIHYFFLGNEARRQQFPRFLALLNEGKGHEEAFRAAFGAGYDELETEVRRYVGKPFFKAISYSADEFAIPPVPEPERIDRAALLVRLGQMLGRAGEGTAADAQRFFSAAAAMNARDGIAWSEMARLHDIRGDPEAARASCEKAVTAVPDDPQVAVTCSRVLWNALARSGQPAAGEMRRLMPLFRRAAEAAPNAAPVHAILGFAHLALSDEESAIAPFRRSVEIDPGQHDLVMTLVQLLASRGRTADARQIVFAAYPSGVEPRLRHRLLVTIAEAEAETRKQSQIDAVNEAVAKYNGGQFAEALKILDEVIPQIADTEILEHAKRLRDEAARHATRAKGKGKK